MLLMFSEEDNGVPALVLLHVVGRECMWRKTQTFIYIYIYSTYTVSCFPQHLR